MNTEQGQPDDLQSFGAWLRRRRKAFDWTQAALADRIGCSAAMIRKIEASERKPSQQLAELLAAALAIPDRDRARFVHAARQERPVASLAGIMSIGLPPHAEFAQPVLNHPHTLPVPMTSLVERAVDTANVARLLTTTDVRLLTLLGSPGIGKTRLAIHVAEQMANHFEHGVWFVDLAPLRDPTLVLPEIASVLGVAESSVSPLLQRLLGVLATKQALLVLDNFEQVNDAAPEIAALLRGCKRLKVLATSRMPLHLTGEHEYGVPPLSLPPADATPDQLLSYEAVQLFVARVRQRQHDFAITPMNAGSIRTVCNHLDGLPLALELAAATLRYMTLRQLAGILQDDANWLHALYSPARDLPSRQRTLYRAIAGSYSLLEPAMQTIFRQLGIFVSGFSALAAQVVCGADQAALRHLVEQSLVEPMPGRWHMLEMIREFALAQMGKEERAEVQQRFVNHFAASARAAKHLNTAIDNTVSDYANFRAALIWATAAQDAQAALTLSVPLGLFWETHGHLKEGIMLMQAALVLPQAVDVRLRFDVLERMSVLTFQHHQFDLALEVIGQATDLARAQDEPELLARALNILGRILIEQGDYEPATTVLQECVDVAYASPSRFSPGCPLIQLGEIALAADDLAIAEERITQALPLLASAEDSMYADRFLAMAHTHLAEIALARGNRRQTRFELRQVLPYVHLHVRRLHFLLVTLAGLLLSTDNVMHTSSVVDAAAMLGAEARLVERTGDSLSPVYQVLLAQRAVAAQQSLSRHEWQVAWNVGYTWTSAQAITEAEKWLVVKAYEQGPD
jgi:predicted ATPase/transcriptional regulator with XRE-family HTH domain